MNAIIGMIQIIKMRGIPNNLINYFTKIDDASHHMMHLINDALDISDMEHGVFRLTNSNFNFHTMIENISREIDNHASEKQQTLKFKVDPAIPASLHGDEKRLRQAITALLANAVKFSDENSEIYFEGKLIGESEENMQNDKISLQIEVTDNGIGISNEQQAKLFNIFEQVDGSLSRKYGGIGAGLVLSKRIVEMMDGAIWLQSELGKGSSFFFTCKLRKG